MKEKDNQKSNSWLNSGDAKKMLAKMMYDSLKEINDRHGILEVFKIEVRINDIKLAEVTNHTSQGASDGSGESYTVIRGQRIPDSLKVFHDSLLDGSFTFTHLKNNTEMYGDIHGSYIVERYIRMVEENVIKIRMLSILKKLFLF